jgi:hypothetical protein
MKQKDIAVIVLVGGISAVFSLILSNLIIGTPTTKKVEVEKVEPISAEFVKLDSRYFNTESVNPTQIIQIQGNTTKPFN